MFKIITSITFFTIPLLFSSTTFSAPLVTGEPIIVQHLGIIDWPKDKPGTTTPYLTQKAANDINDFHGEVTCDLIISTPGNYHMALKDAMKGRADLGHVGLQQQLKTLIEPKVRVCWSTSPPVAIDQINAKKLEFKNILLRGTPALAMAPGAVMTNLVNDNLVDATSVAPLLTNQGNVILIRSNKVGVINNVCDLGGKTRVVTPHPELEPGSFGNFSGTIFDVADQNSFGCDATALFNNIFTQDTSIYDLSVLNNPYKTDRVMSLFGKGTTPQNPKAKWIASSRIMHRDIPYALCNNQADAAVIFYHQAVYLKSTLAATKCNLDIVPLGGTVADPQPLAGNKVGALKIAKVNGNFRPEVEDARTLIYDFLTTNPIWEQILNEYGMVK